ncbi:MAG TPA: Ig-like domain-containing protein [Syntrophomonadaceae bacterium]|nr:Ig-like domain-containing protein [Syntrophomonadaceae bacterium]
MKYLKKIRKTYWLVLFLVLLLTGFTCTAWAQNSLEYKTCPTGGATGVPTDIAVDVVFNQDITLVTSEGITMTAAGGNSINFHPRVDQYVLWLHDPWNRESEESPLPAGDTITVHIPAACLAVQDGTSPGQDIDFSFMTTGGEDHFTTNFVTPVATQTGHNNAPVANPDNYTVETGKILNVDKPGVLINDTDADGDTLTSQVVIIPSHGTLSLGADGSLTYTPSTGFTGPDTFTYKANDGKADSEPATVTITVTPTSPGGGPTNPGTSNSLPVANPDTYTIETGKTLNVDKPGVLANDSDADGDTLTSHVVDNPSHGTLTLNSDGSLTYTPSSGFIGQDTFTYKANDGKADSEPATVTITITPTSPGGGPTNPGTSNSPPVANPDTYTIETGKTLIVDKPGVLANDSDADGNTLTSNVVDNPSHGTLTLNPDGSLTYTPNSEFIGQDTFTYKANDGKVDSNIATVTVKVTSVPANSGGDEGATPGGGGSGTPETVQVPETPHVTTPNQVPQTPKVTVVTPEPVVVPVVTPKMPNTGVDPVGPVVGWQAPAGIYLVVLLMVIAAKRKGMFSSL